MYKKSYIFLNKKMIFQKIWETKSFFFLTVGEAPWWVVFMKIQFIYSIWPLACTDPSKNLLNVILISK